MPKLNLAPELAARITQIAALTDEFCDRYLNAEYRTLCQKAVNALARKNPSPLARGKVDLWAAGIVYALGSTNFLFDRSFPPYLPASDIAAGFETSHSSTVQKADVVKKLLDLGYVGSDAFLTKRIKKFYAEQESTLAQMQEAFGIELPWMPGRDDDAPPTPPSRDGGEFIDGDHPVAMRYYEICEQYERRGPTPQVQKELRALIERDPDYYDSYLLLCEILDTAGRSDEADALLETAYQRAVTRVQGKKKQWPEELAWGWMENRHIIRTFLNKGIGLWTGGETEGALEIFRRLLSMNPMDNPGVRDYILAIRLGMTFEGFEKQFASQFGYDGMKLLDWFDTNSKRFPEEFAAWEEAAKQFE